MSYPSRSLATGTVLAALLAATGCADEQEALIVVLAPTMDAGECELTGAEMVSASGGLLDVSFGTPYLLGVVLQNRLLSTPAMTQNSGIENGEMQLHGADVQLRMPQAPEVLEDVEAENGAFVDFSIDMATISLAPGQRVGVFAEVVSQGASEALDRAITSNLSDASEPILLADVTFKARRTGNKIGRIGEVEARTFSFPIALCRGCLLTCRTCENMECPVAASGGFHGGQCGNAQNYEVGPRACPDPNE